MHLFKSSIKKQQTMTELKPLHDTAVSITSSKMSTEQHYCVKSETLPPNCRTLFYLLVFSAETIQPLQRCSTAPGKGSVLLSGGC